MLMSTMSSLNISTSISIRRKLMLMLMSQQYSIEPNLLKLLRYIPTIIPYFASKLNFHRPKANTNELLTTFAFVSSKLWETVPTN